VRIQEIQEAFEAFEDATSLDDRERLLSVAFDKFVEFRDSGPTDREASVCENIAAHCLNKLEIEGSKLTADEISRNAIAMTTKISSWLRLVDAVRDSGYIVPASLNGMYNSISANYLEGLFRST
jgi:hypothetical protein